MTDQVIITLTVTSDCGWGIMRATLDYLPEVGQEVRTDGGTLVEIQGLQRYDDGTYTGWGVAVPREVE